MRRSWATIDISALQHNWQRVKTFAPNCSVLAMIKSNGYGHGMLTIAKTLPADGFGVACLTEALALRNAGIRQPIVLMMGVQSTSELQQAAAQHISLVVHHAEQIRLLEQTTLTRPISIWLKLDTGMHRLGFPIHQAQAAYERLHTCANVAKPLHVLTHLAEADNLKKNITQQQIQLFKKTTATWLATKSIANSAGIIAWQDSHADWIRPGIMLYGVSPFAERTAHDFDLQPVMTLHTRLIAINTLQRGDAVGYGGTWTCPEEMRVGVVAIGYGDGYPRHAPNGTPLLIRNTLCPMAGRVSMDMLTVDLRNCPAAQVGDIVTLWGKGLPIEEIARHAGTIGYELLCQVTPRVHFEVINT
ncbi:MAG: alanine racemase [Gammaproteobacteria bacterium]